MNCNPLIVKALMHLRGVDEFTLANLVHVTVQDMQAWLYEQGEDSEDRVPAQTQLEVLRVLGVQFDMDDGEIVGYSPRSDIVHYWRVHEPFFSRSSNTYWALNVMLKAFGKAQAVFIAQESDPALQFSAKAHFGLRFDNFYAILQVTAHPMRSISFDPESMADLSWVPDTMGVLLPEAEYTALEPGAMKVPSLQQYLTYNAETVQWARLRDAALEKGIRAEQVANLLMGLPMDAARDAITHDDMPVVENMKTVIAEPEPVAPVAPVAPIAQPTVQVAQTVATPVQAPAPAPAPAQAAPAPAPVQSPAAVTEEDSQMRLFVTPVPQRKAVGVKRVA